MKGKEIMLIVLLCLAILLGSGKSLLFRSIAGSSDDRREFWLTNTVIFAVSFIVLVLFTVIDRDGLRISAYSLILGIFFSAVMIAGQAFYILAQSKGPVSLNTFIYCCGFIIPSVYGMIQDRASVSPLRLLGFVLLIAVLYVYILPRKTKVNGKWVLCISMASLMSGVTGIMQRVHQTSDYANELNSFLSVAFFFCTLFSFALFTFTRKTVCKQTQRGRSWAVLSCSAGLVIALLNITNLFLAGALPSIIFYPVFNGAVTLLTGAVAALVFHEHLKLRQICCLIFGIGAILLLNV